MRRRELLGTLGVVAMGGSAGAARASNNQESPHLKGVPVVTVEELAAAIREEGFQWRHIGHQFDFIGIVVDAEENPRMRIEGMDEGKADTAVLHPRVADHSLKVGQRVQVRGLIVDQWYGVWQVWRYGLSLVDPS
jgi:hypothetical protein